MGSYMPITRICVIGAGPIGLTSAKFLVAEKAFDTIDVYEQSDRVGGVWNITSAERTRRIPIPQTDPNYGHNPHSTSSTQDEDALDFESPMYDYLETNIPKEIMAYSDKPFPDNVSLFPSHSNVTKYLEEYAEEIRHLIRFRTQIEDVRLSESSAPGRDVWTVKARNLDTGVESMKDYDAVVIGNGHYTVPNVPDVKGLKGWSQSYPGKVIHSKAYRRPEEFRGQRVLVIGNSASGLDIATQVSHDCKPPVLLSSRSESVMGSRADSHFLKNVDEVAEFLPSDKYERAVLFKSGRIETHLDCVMFCTGYFFSYPFLSALKPPLITDGLRLQDTYKHLFHIFHPTLVFPCINLKVLPFPLAENQAAVVARVWSGRVSLPPVEEMQQWEANLIKDRGAGRHFHVFKFPEDAIMMNELYDWAARASKMPGAENGGRGRMGSRWDEKATWRRKQFPMIKAAYNALGEDRVKVRTIEETGFVFEDWWKTASRPDKQFLIDAGFDV